MKVHNLKNKKPTQKQLVLVEVDGVVMPAIYYSSLRGGGFYHFSFFYHYRDTVYKKAKIKEKHEIKNVDKWCLMPNSL
ncbi:hypothetical protein [Tenacibaculum finnmarkense]|uniref:hypothetical protein n=1 Tax=Tenacibaculum finnmarkense TaxID=2781243 RepID=UPI002079C349|nr:hypothetical protein [Tenacibaculum finnmarkense]MCM8906801.1 hypothetical protein [Tenacibaculum finnmarkense genomovar finnmarkense]